MTDTTYGPKVYHKQGGDELVVASGGVLNLESGAEVQVDGSQLAALTAQLTDITPADAEGTPDYLIQAITNSTPFGFVNAQECITLLYVVKNLQVRTAELEARLASLGLTA